MVHVSFSSSKSSPNTQTGLQAACADPLSPQGLIVRCSDPTEYPRPAWLGWATITKVRLWRACREFPVKCLHETSLWQRCASGYTRPPGLFRTQQWGYAVCRTLGASCPLSLRKPFALLSDTPPPRCLQVDGGVPSLRFFHKKMGTRVHLILREPHGSWATSSREEVETRAFGKGLLSTDCVPALRVC